MLRNKPVILSCKCGKFIIGPLHRKGAFLFFMMRIVQIDDIYIDELVSHFEHVMFSKRFHRSHTRKYIGIVLTVHKFNYYVPFSSPKARDFNQNGFIKQDDLFTARMTEDDGVGNKKLLGTLKFNNMIPVPMIYVEGYSIENEPDEKYADILLAELKWINKNQEYIKKKALAIYRFKENETKYRNNKNSLRYGLVLPFKEIETYLNTKSLK